VKKKEEGREGRKKRWWMGKKEGSKHDGKRGISVLCVSV
jgi:hypothetical protein